MEIKIPGVDVDSGLNLYDGDVNMYVNILRLFVSKVPPVLEKMRTVSAETLEDYTINIHGIKGKSEYIGAEEVLKTAKQLEAMAKDGDLDGVLAQNEAFIKNTMDFVDSLQNWLKKYDTSGAAL